MADSMMSPSDVAVMMKDNDGWGNGMGFKCNIDES